MCGIAGIAGSKVPDLAAKVEAMIACIQYRGPDDSDVVHLPEQGVALGHRRLSILDLSTAGHQPMQSKDGRYWLVFNGEIYNFVELRSELAAAGHQFSSHSDTEVLLCAYQHWGAACLQRLMGMFAFAIWDVERRELFAARDRLGIKPFYFRAAAGSLTFASEVKSILAVAGTGRKVDVTLLDAYMDFGYVPGAQTLHAGIERLLPGHCLTWRDGVIEIRQYWDLTFGEPLAGSPDEHAELVAALLNDSMNMHLRSDVPVGVFLSGGLDSSAVVAMLATRARGLKTFSIAYDFGAQFDETPYAREVAQRFATDHHELRLAPQDFKGLVPGFVWNMDEPVTEAAAISLYCISRLAREHVVVCLSGEGSDELFGGYDFYRYNLAIETLRRIPGTVGIARGAARGASLLRLRRLAKYLDLTSQPLAARYRGISSYEPRIKRRLYSDGFAATAAAGNDRCKTFIEGLFRRSATWHPLERMLYFDTKTWLVDDLLIKADRMSMAASIELRVPFLDHRLVELAARLPVHAKIDGARTKVVLKRAMQGLLPERIIERQKMGFPTPLEIMFKGELFDYANDMLLSESALGRGYFDRRAVTELLQAHHSGKAKNHREIWQLLVLEEWHRQFGY